MTRLETYAAAALTGILSADMDGDGQSNDPRREHSEGGVFIVKLAWEIAEEMEREGKRRKRKANP